MSGDTITEMQNSMSNILKEIAKVCQGLENAESRDQDLLSELKALKANQETFQVRLTASEEKQNKFQNKTDICETQVKKLKIENSNMKFVMETLRVQLVNKRDKAQVLRTKLPSQLLVQGPSKTLAPEQTESGTDNALEVQSESSQGDQVTEKQIDSPSHLLVDTETIVAEPEQSPNNQTSSVQVEPAAEEDNTEKHSSEPEDPHDSETSDFSRSKPCHELDENTVPYTVNFTPQDQASEPDLTADAIELPTSKQDQVLTEEVSKEEPKQNAGYQATTEQESEYDVPLAGSREADPEVNDSYVDEGLYADAAPNDPNGFNTFNPALMPNRWDISTAEHDHDSADKRSSVDVDISGQDLPADHQISKPELDLDGTESVTPVATDSADDDTVNVEATSNEEVQLGEPNGYNIFNPALLPNRWDLPKSEESRIVDAQPSDDEGKAHDEKKDVKIEEPISQPTSQVPQSSTTHEKKEVENEESEPQPTVDVPESPAKGYNSITNDLGLPTPPCSPSTIDNSLETSVLEHSHSFEHQVFSEKTESEDENNSQEEVSSSPPTLKDTPDSPISIDEAITETTTNIDVLQQTGEEEITTFSTIETTSEITAAVKTSSPIPPTIITVDTKSPGATGTITPLSTEADTTSPSPTTATKPTSPISPTSPESLTSSATTITPPKPRQSKAERRATIAAKVQAAREEAEKKAEAEATADSKMSRQQRREAERKAKKLAAKRAGRK